MMASLLLLSKAESFSRLLLFRRKKEKEEIRFEDIFKPAVFISSDQNNQKCKPELLPLIVAGSNAGLCNMPYLFL